MKSERIYPLFLQKIEDRIKTLISNIFSEEEISDKEEKYRVLISFENNSKREEFIGKYKDFTIKRKFDLISAVNLLLTEKEIQNLKNDILIERIEEDQKLYLSILDVIKNIELNKYRKSQFSFTGKNITIGIIDNGINQEIDSIWDIIEKKYTLQEKGKTKKRQNKEKLITHGTIMANIIGNQYLDYYDRIIGIAPYVKIVDFDISNLKEEYFISDILEIFDIIIKNEKNLDILLISLTALAPSDGKDILSTACNLLAERDILIICPAGNFGPEDYTIGSPSAAEKVITIGSLTKNDEIAYYSGRGPTLDEKIKPDFCLPGSKLTIPFSNDLQITMSGTSIAAALGAGIIALIKEANPLISYKEVLDIFKNACKDLNYANTSQGFGTTNIPEIFKQMDLFQEKTLPYNYLLKRSLKFSGEFIIFLIILYLAFYFIDFSRFF